MSLCNIIDLFVDSESCEQPLSFSLTLLTLGGSQLSAHGTVPGTTTTRENLALGGKGRACREQSEEWSLDLQLMGMKEQRWLRRSSFRVGR